MHQLVSTGCVAILLLLSGCYESHTSEDGSADASILEDARSDAPTAEPDAGPIAPPCVEPPTAPCLELREVGARSFPSAEGMWRHDVLLYGLGLHDHGGQALVSAVIPESARRAPFLVGFSLDSVYSPTELDESPTHYTSETALGVASSGGLTWSVWRYVVRSHPGGSVDQTETLAVSASGRGLVGAPQLVERMEGAVPGSSGEAGLAILPRPDGDAWVASADGNGLKVQSVDGSLEWIAWEDAASGPVHIAPLPDAIAVLWHEPTRAGFRAAHLTVLREDGSTAADEVLLEVTSYRSALLSTGGELYAALFERDEGDLRGSHIRIFRMDRELRRLEADRTYVGWGGLSPSGIGLVMFAGEPWLVWQTVDSRIDPHDSVFAFPVRGSACAATVEAPLAVAAGRPTVSPSSTFAVAADNRTLWIGRVEGNASTASTRTVRIYAAAGCE